MSEAAVARPTRFIDPRGLQRRLQTVDFVVLVIATLVVFLGSSLFIPAHAASLVGVLSLEVALGSIVMMSWIGLYGLDVVLDLKRAVVSSLAATVGLGSVVFLTTHVGLFALEAGWLAGWLALCVVHFGLTRTAAYMWARPRAAAGAFLQRVAVVGWGEEAQEAVRLLEVTDPLRLEVVGVFDDRRRSDSESGAMADLVSAAHGGSVDLVVVAIPFALEERLLQTLRRLWQLPVDVRIAAQTSHLKLSPRAYGYLGKLPLLTVFDRPLSRRRGAKQLFDRALAALLLVLLLPVIVLAALAMRLEARGPLLVREERCGFDGAAIPVYSFGGAAGHESFVGRALRKLRLAGVPQLLNVLKGELSLVGPRLNPPGCEPSLYREVIDGYFARHKIKPGIIGWSQINGWAEDAGIGERTTKHDLEYVDRWSLLLDLYILFKAPFSLLRKSPAR